MAINDAEDLVKLIELAKFKLLNLELIGLLQEGIAIVVCPFETDFSRRIVSKKGGMS